MAISGGDGSIILTTQVDQTGLKRGMSSMQSGVNGLTKGFAKLGAAIIAAFSVKALVSFSNEAAKMASTTEASVQRLIDIYGKASQEVGNFIDANAHAIGMSKSAAAQYASVYGNLFSVWADQTTNAQLTNQYLNATAVVASKTGRTMEDVQERIRSGLLGNTEAVEDLGIFVNVKTIEMTNAFARIANGRSWEQLTAYEQSQVRALAILEQATNKYGNQVAQTNALTRAQYNAAYQDFKNTWGTVINYILMPILKALTKIFQFATMALQAIFKISGKTINVDTSSLDHQEQAIGGAVENQQDLTNSVKETAKEQKKLLAGFDDLQILSQSSPSGDAEKGATSGGGGGGGGSGGIGPLPEFTESQGTPPLDLSSFDGLLQIISTVKDTITTIKDILIEISNLFMTGFWDGFQNADFSVITQSISGIKDSLLGIFTSSEVQTSIQEFADAIVIAVGQTVGSYLSIGTTIATNIFGGLEKYLQENETYIKERIAGFFDASTQIVTSVGNMWTAFADIFSVLASENGQNLTANIIEIFSNAVLGIADLASKMGADFINLLTQPITENQESLKTTLNGVLGIFSTFTGDISTLVSDLFIDIISLYNEHISPFITSLTEGISGIVTTITEAFNEYILPVIQDFATEFGKVINEYVKPAIDKFLSFIGSIIDLVKVLWEQWLAPFINWLIELLAPIFATIFGGLGEIINTLLATISTVFGSIFTILEGFVTFLTGVFSGDMSMAWEGIEQMWSGLTEFFSGLWEGIKSIFSTVGQFFMDTFSAAWEGIISVFSAGGDIFNEIVKGVVTVFKIIVNALIDGINWVIAQPFEGLNGILDAIQYINILGVEPFGWLDWRAPVPKIPHLAQGTVVPPNREFLAVLGDNKKEHEIVSPLSTMKQAFIEALREAGGNSNGGLSTVILEIDGREFGRAVIEQGNRENRRIGTRLVMA